jgi:hypothetical protein
MRLKIQVIICMWDGGISQPWETRGFRRPGVSSVRRSGATLAMDFREEAPAPALGLLLRRRGNSIGPFFAVMRG